MTRITISKKTRFEVFKRDKFTCQYCGKKSPDVVLHIDHIKPVADGGLNDVLNLVTACFDCNSGKGARKLSDHAVLDAQRAQLEALQERREQLEMLIEWRNELSDLGVTKAVALERAICDELRWDSLTEYGRGQLQVWLKKYALDELFECLNIAVSQYLKFDQKGPTQESAKKVFDYLPKIAAKRKIYAQTPWLRNYDHIKSIMRKRMYVGEREASEILTEALSIGIEAEYLKQIAAHARNWTAWCQEMRAIIAEVRPPNGP